MAANWMSFTTSVDFWMYSAILLIFLFMGMVLLFILIAKRTHAVQEFKASFKGVPLCLFFTDHKSVEWMSIKPDAGMIQCEKYGSFIQNEEANYIDRTTKNIVIPLSASHSMAAPVEVAADADAISKVIQDPKALGALRELLANGRAEEFPEFAHLKESVNFSKLKGLLNTMVPHNITALVNMKVSHQMGTTGQKGGQQFIFYVFLGLGLVVLLGIVMWLIMGKGNTPAAQQVVISAGDIAKAMVTQNNMTVLQ